MRRRSSIAGRPDLARPYNLFGPVGRRNAKQKLSYLANRGVPPALVELLEPFADQARGRDLLWFSIQLDRAMAGAAPDLNAMRATEQEMIAAFPDLLDWLGGTRPNYSGMTWRAALQRSEAWHQAMADKRPRNKRMKSRDVILELPDNWAWVRIPEKEYRDEGELMGHCFGRGGNNPGRGAEGYSLRDPWNRPHVTLDVKWTDGEGWSLGQIKGKGNQTPVKIYAERALEFLLAHPWGPSMKLPRHGDLSRVLATVYGDDVEKRDKVLRRISPAVSINTRARLTREVIAPETILASMIRRNPGSIPVVYSHLTTKEMLERMARARSMATVQGWARAAVNRMETMSRMRGKVGGGRYFDYKHWAQSLADDLGLPLPASATPETLARMRRKARSGLARERRIAALVLPPRDLRAMIQDTDPAVRSILSLRLEGDDVIWAVLRKQGKDPTLKMFTAGKEVPGWDEGVLVWRLSDKAFKKIHDGLGAATPEWHGFDSEIRKQIIIRASSLDIAPILSPKDMDCDTFQLISQGTSLEHTAPYVERFYECWFGPGDADPNDPEGGPEFEMWDSLDQMVSESLLAKWAVAAPALWADMSGHLESIEAIPGWLAGRPAKRARDLMAAIEQARDHQPWEEYGVGEVMVGYGPQPEEPAERINMACGLLIEPLYAIARHAGKSDTQAWDWATSLWSLDEFAEERRDTCRQRSRENWKRHKNSPPRRDSIYELDIETPWRRQ